MSKCNFPLFSILAIAGLCQFSFAATSHVITPPSGAVRIACSNNSNDANVIQSAINSNSAVVLTGTCDLGDTTLYFGSNFFLGGSATLNYTGGYYAVASDGNYNTITGLTFNGGGLILSLNDQTNWTGQYGWTIQGNQFQNITNGSSAVYVANIIGKGAASTINYNNFVNIWPNGYPNFPDGYSADTCGQDCLLGNGSGGSGIWVEMGLDNVKMNYNNFRIIGGNAIKGFWDGFMGYAAPYEGHNVEMSHNVMTQVHRIGIEVQAAGKGACPGGCNYDLIPTDGTMMKDNFFHNPAFPGDTFGYSFMAGGTNVKILNNTAADENPVCYWPLGLAIENAMSGGLAQGNVTTSAYQSCAGNYNDNHGWAAMLVSGYTAPGYTDSFYNNYACGDGVVSPTLVSDDPYNNATMDEQADYGSTSCPSNIAATNISMSFTSSNNQNLTGVSSGTFKVALKSTLSVQYVQFFLDSSTTPAATQEIQDFNSNFTNNPQWLYHATINLSHISTGTHKITAKATDVAGGTRSVSQTFVH